MKTLILFASILVFLSPLSIAADEVRISTTILTIPESVDLPPEVRTVSMGEWQGILRTLSQIKGVPLFTTPAATASSGKMTRVDIGRQESEGFWFLDPNPVFPIASIQYTPKSMRGGIELVGEFTMNRESMRSSQPDEIITAAKVHGYIPDGKVLTFKIGQHLFGVKVVEDK
jgi:hypothetical protein